MSPLAIFPSIGYSQVKMEMYLLNPTPTVNATPSVPKRKKSQLCHKSNFLNLTKFIEKSTKIYDSKLVLLNPS